MGRELGISSVVVLLSLLFWGWVLGPIGLFLSVPLTMVLIVALNVSPYTRSIAIMLGTNITSTEVSDDHQIRERTELAGNRSEAPR